MGAWAHGDLGKNVGVHPTACPYVPMCLCAYAPMHLYPYATFANCS